jgi:hypothetical protein
MTQPQLNTLFPGRPNYTGPTEGWFGLLHHSNLFEHSHNVMERVAYVIRKKAPQVEIRLHNMIYLGDLGVDYVVKHAAYYADYGAKRNALMADYKAKCAPLYDEYEVKRAPLWTEYEAKRALLYDEYEAKRGALLADILVYIKHHIPDCAWNGTELVFGAQE